jgi:hypothetical protein
MREDLDGEIVFSGSEQEFVEMPNWRVLGHLPPSGIFST